MNPYDKRAAIDLQLWQTWKNSGYKKKHLKPLQDRMQGIVGMTVNKYRGVNISEPLLRAEANKHLVQALKEYNPNAGAAVGSYVMSRQVRVDRFVKENQNFGRVVEQRAQKWAYYTGARDMLEQELGRTPSATEIANKMNMKLKKPISPKEAERFMKEDRRDLIQSGLDQNAFVHTPTPDRIVLKMLPAELSPQENAVFDRTFGLNGSRKMNPGQIAKDLKIHNSKVSRIKKTILKKIEDYY